MASSKRGRRPGGHPAKVAERRERERARTEGPEAELRRVVAAFRRDGEEFETALDAELWASTLLGSWWPFPLGADEEETDLAIGGPLVAALGRAGDAGAMAVLVAIGVLSGTELGSRAGAEADRLHAAGIPWPPWTSAIMDPELVRAAALSDRVFGDGTTIFVEARHDDDDEPHVVGVYIDANLGGMAKDILLAVSIGEIADTVAAGRPGSEGLVLEPMDLGEAGARIRAAMDLTDMTIEAPVGEEYAALRSLALLRADEVPGGGSALDLEPPVPTAEEREALLADFHAAPEGAAFEAGGDHLAAVGSAINFASDYAGGDPLRWSPVSVEIFMADWLPRKLLAGRAMFEAVPAALDAFVRYAARIRDRPDAAVTTTVEAIASHTAEMLERSADAGSAGPAKQFASAVQAAGIDLQDAQAVESFIAGWNARSDV